MDRPRWLQLNLYAPPDAQDAILTDILGPAVAELRAVGWLRSWFFIRYFDSQWAVATGLLLGNHLRVRFHAPPRWHDTIAALLRKRARGAPIGTSIAAIRSTRYRTELMGFGGRQAIRLAEQIFRLDSDLVVEIVQEPGVLLGRLAASAFGLEALLSGLGLGTAQRRELYAGYARRRAQRFRLGPADEQALNQQYRAKRRLLLALLERSGQPVDGAEFLDRYRVELALIGDRFRALERAGALTHPLSVVATWLVHMHCNRAGLSLGPELALTWCLWRAAEEAWP